MAKIVKVTVKDTDLGKNARPLFKHKVSLTDWKQLAILFSDLEIHGAKIEKAYAEFRKLKKDTWPF